MGRGKVRLDRTPANVFGPRGGTRFEKRRSRLPVGLGRIGVPSYRGVEISQLALHVRHRPRVLHTLGSGQGAASQVFRLFRKAGESLDR